MAGDEPEGRDDLRRGRELRDAGGPRPASGPMPREKRLAWRTDHIEIVVELLDEHPGYVRLTLTHIGHAERTVQAVLSALVLENCAAGMAAMAIRAKQDALRT